MFPLQSTWPRPLPKLRHRMPKPGNLPTRISEEPEKAYDSAGDLLADDTIDVVHVVTPNATHLEFALAAIRAGKHVVCEKPLATSTADAGRLAAAAAAGGVTATVPFVYRFHPMVREARARVRAGETGRLLSIQGSYLQDWLLAPSDDNWRVDA